MKNENRIFILILASLFLFTFILPAFAADTVQIQSITLDQETVVVSAGKTASLKATIDPKNASNKKLEWVSSDEAVATVNNGKIKGLTPGSAKITVKATDGSSAEASATVTVVLPVKKITVSEPKLLLAPGASWKQTVTIEPSDATIQTLIWSSSNDNVASVNEKGEIQAKTVGKCTIIGMASDDSKQKVNISVQVAEHDYVILEPGEIDVEFETRNSTHVPKGEEPFVIGEDGEKMIITDEVFEKAHHIDSPDGRILVSVPDKEQNYRYFEKDPETGIIFESSVRNLTLTTIGKNSKKTKQSKQNKVNIEETTVTFRNGLAGEGSEEHKIKPLKAGSETVDIITKLNGKKVTDQRKYTVFISQDAVSNE